MTTCNNGFAKLRNLQGKWQKRQLSICSPSNVDQLGACRPYVMQAAYACRPLQPEYRSGFSKLQNTVYIVQWLPMCIKLFSYFLVINLPECITITSQIFQDVKVFSWQQQNCFISTYVRVESFTKKHACINVHHTLHNAYILARQPHYIALRAGFRLPHI